MKINKEILFGIGFLLIGIGAILLISVFILLFADATYYTNKVQGNQCLIDIAKSYCNKIGLNYDNIYYISFRSIRFSCIEERSTSSKKEYIFYRDEIERCLK